MIVSSKELDTVSSVLEVLILGVRGGPMGAGTEQLAAC